MVQKFKQLLIALYKKRIIIRFRSMNKRPTFLVINATGRSGTSLLTYVLCSNPEISGYGESHTAYHDCSNIEQHVAEIYWQQRSLDIKETYFLDKVVYNRHIPDIDVIESHPTCWVFILRDPVSTIASTQRYVKCSEAEAVEHYLARVKQLRENAIAINSAERAIFITYEALTKSTKQTLKSLSDFLTLKESLSDEYHLPKAATEWRVSDQSERLRENKISSKTTQYSSVLQAQHSESIWDAYAETIKCFQQYCTVPEVVKDNLSKRPH